MGSCANRAQICYMSSPMAIARVLCMFTLLFLISSDFCSAQSQQPSIFRQCSDIATRTIGYNYIKYSGSVGSVSARELIVSPSIGNTAIFFNRTVAQLPKVPNPTANQLTVPLLLRQNFTENKWYLVCARANNSDCSQCDVIFRQSCQNNFYGRSFIDFTIVKSNPGFGRIGISVVWRAGLGVQIPFDYIVQVEVKWSPYSCVNEPQYSSLTVDSLQCGRPSTSRAYTVRYLDQFALSGLSFDLPVEPIANMFTVTVAFELRVGDTVRRIYPGTNIQDSYALSLAPVSFARFANSQQVLSLLLPFQNADSDYDAMRNCMIIEQNNESIADAVTAATLRSAAHYIQFSHFVIYSTVVVALFQKLFI